MRHDAPRRRDTQVSGGEPAVTASTTLSGASATNCNPLTLVSGSLHVCATAGKALFRWPFNGASSFCSAGSSCRSSLHQTIAVHNTADGAVDLHSASAGPVRRGGRTLRFRRGDRRGRSGPATAVLVVAGARGSACADWCRTIREIDAMECWASVPSTVWWCRGITRLDAGRHAAQRPLITVGLVGGFLFPVSICERSGAAPTHHAYDHQPARGGHRNHQSRNVRPDREPLSAAIGG